MESPENDQELKLDFLLSLATQNTTEAWQKIDEKLPSICDRTDILNWAKENTQNEDDGLRDLAATILETSDLDLEVADILKLKELMLDKSYPGFRAACALAKRFKNPAVSPAIALVKQKLQDFLKDEDVSEIARKYLDLLK